MKTTRNADGYLVTKGAEQYQVFKNGHGWTIILLSSEGREFNWHYETKAEAVAAISQG